MIGYTVYRWDENRRVYPKVGGVGRAPIWREHWKPTKIVGETSRSWVTEDDEKLPKGRPLPRGWCMSLEEVYQAEYVHLYRNVIANKVQALRGAEDFDKLRKVALALGDPLGHVVPGAKELTL